jgi:hypothetical protein
MSSSSPQWLFYAICSGLCAALNGVFAKLTTTALTSDWAEMICRHLSMRDRVWVVEAAIRAVSNDYRSIDRDNSIDSRTGFLRIKYGNEWGHVGIVYEGSHVIKQYRQG